MSRYMDITEISYVIWTWVLKSDTITCMSVRLDYYMKIFLFFGPNEVPSPYSCHSVEDLIWVIENEEFELHRK